MVHENTPRSSDLFDTVLTTLDPDVALDLVHITNDVNCSGGGATAGNITLVQDVGRAEKIGREVTIHSIQEDPGPAIARLVSEKDYDLVVMDAQAPAEGAAETSGWRQYVQEHASCAVCLLSLPAISREVVDSTPSSVFEIPEKPKPR